VHLQAAQLTAGHEVMATAPLQRAGTLMKSHHAPCCPQRVRRVGVRIKPAFVGEAIKAVAASVSVP
jgi:hypothetical protein